MTDRQLTLTRTQILAYRRRVQSLNERLPRGKRSLRRAAWAGLQDSMPRAALLSIHARVRGVEPSTWDAPSLVQLWGPRFSTYVVAERDRGVFSLGRLSDDPDARRTAEDLAERLRALLDGQTMLDRDAGPALGMHPNALRYAAPTGTVLIRWDGARAPAIWSVPAPEVDPQDARKELARRYLHVFGPATPDSFAQWAGVRPPHAAATFHSIRRSLTPVRTPTGEGWILTRDASTFDLDPEPPAPARLLPSGDTYYLLQDADRDLLLPDTKHQDALWTSRVWPGALLVGGDIVGTWRRRQGTLTIQAWRSLSRGERDAVEAEAAALPLPGVHGQVTVTWDD
jgi:hypothetical protein